MRLNSLRLRLSRVVFGADLARLQLPTDVANRLAESEHRPLLHDLDLNVDALRELWRDQSELVVRRLKAGGRPFALLYVKGTVDERRLEADGISPLRRYEGSLNNFSLDEIAESIIDNLQVQRIHRLGEAARKLVTGHALLLAAGEPHALAIQAEMRTGRSVALPPNEAVVRGPHEGFTEAMDTNLALLRSRLKTPRLRFETFMVGRVAQTTVKIAYLDGLAKDRTLAELRERIGRIEIDAVLESGYIEEFIEETPYTIFPTVWGSERPDAVAAQLLEGGVAIIVDGSPWVMAVPTTFWSLLQSNEDYYQRFDVSSFLRLQRVFAALVGVFLPGLFVAVVLFHPESIPAPLFLQIAATSETTPLPTVAEVLLMLVAFDVLREAGIRLPNPVGQTIGIVGGLFVGQMSVQAGLVTPTIVIVAALSTICTFLVPHYPLGNSLRLLRYFVLFFSATTGSLGVVSAFTAILAHLAWLRSFGIPYLWPAQPSDYEFVKDALIRVPWWRMWRRPMSARRPGSWREGFPLRPHSPERPERPTSGEPQP